MRMEIGIPATNSVSTVMESPGVKMKMTKVKVMKKRLAPRLTVGGGHSPRVLRLEDHSGLMTGQLGSQPHRHLRVIIVVTR